MPPAPSRTDTAVPSARSTTMLPTEGGFTAGPISANPCCIVMLGSVARMVTEPPAAVTVGWVLVPLISTDFTEDALKLPRFESRTMVQEKVDPPLHELRCGSTYTSGLAVGDGGAKEVMTAVAKAMITAAIPATRIFFLSRPDPSRHCFDHRLLW